MSDTQRAKTRQELLDVRSQLLREYNEATEVRERLAKAILSADAQLDQLNEPEPAIAEKGAR